MPVFPGFLLTRHWRDQRGLELVFWAHSPAGPVRLLLRGQQAVCFCPRTQALEGLTPQPERRSLALHGMDGPAVDGLYFTRQRDLLQFRDQARQRRVRLYESDVKPHDRFLMERFVTAAFEAEGEARRHDGFLELLNPRLRPAELEPALSHVSLDIETDGIDGEVLSVALTAAQRELVLMQGRAQEWPGSQPVRWFADEPALLRGLLETLQQWDPDLILGWNLVDFDLEVLERRCSRNRIPFALGRGGEIAAVLAPQAAGQARVASIPGRVALDGIATLRAGFWSFESFELGAVARELLGRGKLIDAGTDKIGEIRRRFREDRQALAAYNLEDCRLVEAIFAHADLVRFAEQRSLMTGLPLGRQGGSVAAFDNLYLPRLHRAGLVAFDVGAAGHREASPGGYVMDSLPGIYDNVLVLDFKSLYPSIIRTFRIDPLGLARPGEDPVPGHLGGRFSRTDSILPQLISELWARRDTAKRAGNKPLSQAVKIIMNSFYGVLGSAGCRFFDPRLASSITRRGHEIIRRSRDWIQEHGRRVIYGDTDSLFVLLGEGYDEARAAAVGRDLAAGLNAWWRHTLRRELDLECFLEIEFETHFLRFLMPTLRGADSGSKKRYAGTVRRPDGGLGLVFKGLESVRSDWTPLARELQRELYRRIFLGEPWVQYLRDTVARLRAGELDAQLVYRKRLRQSLDAYRRNVPPHVQAARKLARPGRWIRYLITVNGPEPVQAHTSPIDYRHYIDRQLAPVADGILHFLGESFERVTGGQMELF